MTLTTIDLKRAIFDKLSSTNDTSSDQRAKKIIIKDYICNQTPEDNEYKAEVDEIAESSELESEDDSFARGGDFTFKDNIAYSNFLDRIDLQELKSIISAAKALHNHVFLETSIHDEYTFDKLAAIYPIKSNDPKIEFEQGKVKVYRGFNFAKKEDLEDFESKIFDTGIKSNHASSWTYDFGTAMDFAQSPKTYNVSQSVINAEEARDANFEDIAGYGGLIVEAWINPEDGISLSDTPHSSEPEILVRPGVTVHPLRTHDIKTFRRQIEDGDIDINQELISKASDNEDLNIIRHILAFHLNAVKDSTADQLFVASMKHFNKLLDDGTHEKDIKSFTSPERDALVYTHKDPYTKEDTIDGVYPALLFNYAKKGIFNTEQYIKVQEIANRAIDYLLLKSEETGIQNIGASAFELSTFADSDRCQKLLQAKVAKSAKVYHQLNSKENIRSINQLSGEAQKKAIDEYEKNIMKALSDIVGSSTNIRGGVTHETLPSGRKISKPKPR